MYVCVCKGITERVFRELVARHRGALDAITREMGLNEQSCGRCAAKLEALIQECWARSS